MQQCSSTYYHARVCVKVQSLKAPYVWTPYVQNYGVLLLHCLKSPPRSFKNQQVPVSLGNWADVTVLMTESSFCLHLCQRSPIRNTHRPDMYGFPGLDLKFIWKETAQFWPWIDLVYNNIFGIQLSFCVFCVTFGKCVEFQGKTITFMFNYLLLLLSNLKKKKDQIWPRMEELKGRKVLNVYVVSKKPPEPQPQCAKPSLRLWGEQTGGRSLSYIRGRFLGRESIPSTCACGSKSCAH